MEEAMAPEDHPLLLFDGLCNLCNASVQFVIRRDPEGSFHFASMQSAFGKAVLAQQQLSEAAQDSVVLLYQGKLYQKSDAVLEVLRQLGPGFPLVRLLAWIPKSSRDGLYDWIARRRSAWFGRAESCPMLEGALRQRFPGEDMLDS